MSYILEKIIKNNFLFIPILFMLGYIIFPNYLYNAYYVSCASMISFCALLYKFDKFIFIMHQKPTYFEKAIIFKTQIETNQTNINEDEPEIRLIREVDTYLTTKFIKIFKHVLIIIDSFMCGFLSYWIFMHLTTDEKEYLIKNIGIFGGYVSLCGKAHVYIGKIILYFLKKNKEKVRVKEIQKRIRLSNDFNNDNKNSIELPDIILNKNEEEKDNNITKPILTEGYLDYFETEFIDTFKQFTDNASNKEDISSREEDISSKEETEVEKEENISNKEDVEKEELKIKEFILHIDSNPPKSAMLVNKIRKIIMFEKPKEIGYTPNIIIIHY